jgi:tetratricopeptide (TPR) repeat protein
MAEFLSLTDEAYFHSTPHADLYPIASRQAAQKAALEALAKFRVAALVRDGPHFDAPFTNLCDQRREIMVACYEMLLVLAEAVAQRDSAPRLREALQILERATALHAPTKAYFLRQARYLEQLGDTAGAARASRQAAAAQPTSAHDYFLLGQELQRQGNQQDAIRALDDALRLQPDYFWARYFLAICHMQSRRLSELRIAKACLDSCLLKRKEFAWAYLVRGSIRGQLGEFVAAEEDFDSALKIGRNDNDIRYSVLINRGIIRRMRAAPPEMLAGWFPVHGDVTPALADFQEAIRLKPDRYQAYMSLAKALEQQKNRAAAKEQLDKAIDIARPQVKSRDLEPLALVRLYQYRAEVLVQRKEFGAALADLDQALNTDPDDTKSAILAEIHAARGRILHVNKDYAKAVAAYDAAFHIREHYPDAHLWRGEALVELGRFEEATRSLDRYLQHGGKPLADVYRKRAQAQAKLHKYSEAIADYTLALRLEPKGDTYANRGWIQVLAKAHPLALNDFEEAIRLDPKNSDAHNGRGLMRAKLGKPNAEADAQQALHLGPKTARRLWGAARIYAELVTRIDMDRNRGRNRGLSARFDYQHEALQLLRQALGLTNDEERASFWHGVIERDDTFDSIRSSPGYAELRVEFAQKR